MELAVIAPVHALSPVTALKYQWALTSKFDNENYKRFFLHQSDSDKYVILMQDDSIRPFLLAQYADDIGAREIVLPFAKNQYYETKERIKETLMGLAVDRESSEILRGLRPRFMIVPQGEDLYNWSHCLKASLEIYANVRDQFGALFPFDPVIGMQASWISTLTVEKRENTGLILQSYARYPQHLLEWNTLTTFGLKFRSVSTMVPFIRASGMLFNINGQFLNRKFSQSEQDAAQRLIKQLRKRV